MIYPFIFSLKKWFTYWSALATAPTSASAGAKKASISTEFSVLLLFLFVSNHKTATSKQPKIISLQPGGENQAPPQVAGFHDVASREAEFMDFSTQF